MKGTVKWFNTTKRFGFIKGDDGEEYFVHNSQLPDGVKELKDNEEVFFDTDKTERGLQAKNVRFEDGGE